MNILITGAGLIGAHAARQMVDAGHKVVLFDLSPNRDYIGKVVGKDKADVVAANMLDLPALLTALEKFNVDTMVHTAGLIGGRVQENSYTGATNNILGTINILEAARLRKLRRVVYVSTFGVYDRDKITDSVISESVTLSAATISTPSPSCAPSIWSMPTRACTTSTPSSSAPAVFSAAAFMSAAPLSAWSCATWRLAMIKGDPITIDAKTYGPNEYVYGKDVGLALLLACQAQNPKQRIYNAGTGAVHGAEQLAQVVREVAPKLEVKVSGSSVADKSRSIPMDISI